MHSSPTPKKHPLSRLLDYAKDYRPQIWNAATFTIINKILDLAPPYLIGVAVDIVVEKENSLIAKIGITNIIGQLVVCQFAICG